MEQLEATIVGTVFRNPGIERYLGSGLIRGVGPSTASLIVAAFGEDTLTVLSEHPERLCEVKGIGEKRAAMISESFLEQQGARRALVFLQSYGIPRPWPSKSASSTGTGRPKSSGRIPTVSVTTWKASVSKPRTGSACPSGFRRTVKAASAAP